MRRAQRPLHWPDDPGRRLAVTVMLPFAAGYFLSYLYRSINAIVAPDLIAGFALSAADLGLLTSAFFLTFAAFQLPLGILLDRIGPRRTNGALLLFAAAGALVFATSESLSGLLVGRALIGFGMSACLMASIKAVTIWFPLQRLPATTGWVMFAGGIGAMFATVPVEFANQIVGWRGVFAMAAGLTLLVSAALFFVAPERASAGRAESLGEQWRGVLRVLGSSVFWRVAAVSAVFQAVNMSIQGLWAGPWLSDVASYSRPAVAMSLLGFAAATTAGFLFWGLVASRLATRGITPLRLFKIGTTIFVLVQIPLALGITFGAWLCWVVFGLCGTAGSLVYTILSRAFPVAMTGRANTALNMLVFLGAFLVQWAFGAVVSLWPPIEGHYHPDGYRAAFGAMVVLEAIALVWLLLAARLVEPARQ
ncbi:MAG: MFS transporter [Burkholderiales bacterium]